MPESARTYSRTSPMGREGLAIGFERLLQFLSPALYAFPEVRWRWPARIFVPNDGRKSPDPHRPLSSNCGRKRASALASRKRVAFSHQFSYSCNSLGARCPGHRDPVRTPEGRNLVLQDLPCSGAAAGVLRCFRSGAEQSLNCQLHLRRQCS